MNNNDDDNNVIINYSTGNQCWKVIFEFNSYYYEDVVFGFGCKYC